MKNKPHIHKIRNKVSLFSACINCISRIFKSGVSALFFFAFYTVNAQDIHFSQFYAAPLQLSPSFAGAQQGTRFISNYRIQWPEVHNSFSTYALSIDHNFTELHSGIGLLLLRDVKGDLDISSNCIGLVYSYDVRIKKEFHFRPGVSFTYIFSGFDPSSAVTRDMLQGAPSAAQPYSRTKVNYFDASLSGLFYNRIFWLGTTIDHLTQPNVAFGTTDKMPIEVSVYSGIKLTPKGKLIKPPNENLTLAFHFMKMAEFNQLNIGIMGFKEFIRLGIWYRGIPVIKDNPGSDALILSVGYEKDQFSAGISHDFTISGLASYTNGANEIFISYIIPYSKPKKKYMAIPCPVF